MLQPNTGKEIGSHEPPHLAQRVLFNHARQLKTGLVGAAGREQKECAVPLTQVRRQRLALDGETESALRFSPVVLIVTGDDAQHRVGFRELRVDFERALRELARPRHRLMRRRTADCRRSEEHTSELQSQSNLVCRLLLEKKKQIKKHYTQTELTN